jgi:hypothetical protein
VSSDHRLPASLPAQAGYTHVLGVPMEVVDRLRSLHLAALDGGMSLQTWTAQHAGALAGHHLDVDPGHLEQLVVQVATAATASLDDFDRWLFLTELQKNLQLLLIPDPSRELRQLEASPPALTGEQTWPQSQRHLHVLRALTGGTEPEPYEPGTRMIKALRVGTLEETNRWLRAALAQHPRASVQDLLTWAAIEVADAKMELDRYDALQTRPDSRTAP